jgi:hypothetical protein
MPLPKSKAFWAFTTAASALGGIIAYDRFRLKQIRERFTREAEEMGMQPATENIRKITIVAFGRDGNDLQKIRKNWKKYAVDLITKAGCDYQRFEVNAAKLDKELDKLVPVPDGIIPENKEIPRILTADNWIKPTMLLWMQRLNPMAPARTVKSAEPVRLVKSAEPAKPVEPTGPTGPVEPVGLDRWRSDTDVTMRTLYGLWESQRPEPRSPRFFEDGIVAIEMSSRNALISGIEEFEADSKRKARILPKIGYIPCDSPLSWRSSIYYVQNVSLIFS